MLALFGDCGYGSCALNTFVRSVDKETLVYILRTPKEQHLDCAFALICITELKKIPVTLRTLKVASCVRTCLNNLESIYVDAVQRDTSMTASECAVEVTRIKSKLSKLDIS